MACGIYKITNVINGKFYIGSSGNLKNRCSIHFAHLRRNSHSNKHLQNSYNKYGENNFIFSIVEECEKDKLIELEQKYIDTLRPQYNKRIVASSNIGIKRSPETIEKMRLSRIGKKLSFRERTKGIVRQYKSLPGVLISPTGDKFMGIINMEKFGREHGIDKRRMSEFLNGIRTTWRGWEYVAI